MLLNWVRTWRLKKHFLICSRESLKCEWKQNKILILWNHIKSIVLAKRKRIYRSPRAQRYQSAAFDWPLYFFKTRKAQNILIASVCMSCLKPKKHFGQKFGRLKTKFDDDAGSAKRPRKTKFGPTFYVFYLKLRPFLKVGRCFFAWRNGWNSPTHFAKIVS